MPSNAGECFIALNPHSEENCVIYGRNSLQSEGEVQEVVYFPSSEDSESVQCDGGAKIDCNQRLAVILSRSAGLWGGESGANSKNVTVGITWSDGEPTGEGLKSTDIVRLTLERSSSADEAISVIAALNDSNGNDASKFSFIICDPKEAWLLSVGGKLWAAEQVTTGYHRISTSGLAVTSKIDKSSDGLGEKLKECGLWDGSGDLDFAKSFSASPTNKEWSGAEPPVDGTFKLTDMFEILRTTGTESAQSSHVSTLIASGISCHWFTATPNPRESVFKPFVFAPNARISPLTKLPDGESTTLLHKLHNQRNWENVGELLKSLESTCVEEVKGFLAEHPTPNQELDDLMKDCVEAEVKFYR